MESVAEIERKSLQEVVSVDDKIRNFKSFSKNIGCEVKLEASGESLSFNRAQCQRLINKYDKFWNFTTFIDYFLKIEENIGGIKLKMMYKLEYHEYKPMACLKGWKKYATKNEKYGDLIKQQQILMFGALLENLSNQRWKEVQEIRKVLKMAGREIMGRKVSLISDEKVKKKKKKVLDQIETSELVSESQDELNNLQESGSVMSSLKLDEIKKMSVSDQISFRDGEVEKLGILQNKMEKNKIQSGRGGNNKDYVKSIGYRFFILMFNLVFDDVVIEFNKPNGSEKYVLLAPTFATIINNMKKSLELFERSKYTIFQRCYIDLLDYIKAKNLIVFDDMTVLSVVRGYLRSLLRKEIYNFEQIISVRTGLGPKELIQLIFHSNFNNEREFAVVSWELYKYFVNFRSNSIKNLKLNHFFLKNVISHVQSSVLVTHEKTGEKARYKSFVEHDELLLDVSLFLYNMGVLKGAQLKRAFHLNDSNYFQFDFLKKENEDNYVFSIKNHQVDSNEVQKWLNKMKFVCGFRFLLHDSKRGLYFFHYKKNLSDHIEEIEETVIVKRKELESSFNELELEKRIDKYYKINLKKVRDQSVEQMEWKTYSINETYQSNEQISIRGIVNSRTSSKKDIYFSVENFLKKIKNYIRFIGGVIPIIIVMKGVTGTSLNDFELINNEEKSPRSHFLKAFRLRRVDWKRTADGFSQLNIDENMKEKFKCMKKDNRRRTIDLNELKEFVNVEGCIIPSKFELIKQKFNLEYKTDDVFNESNSVNGMNVEDFREKIKSLQLKKYNQAIEFDLMNAFNSIKNINEKIVGKEELIVLYDLLKYNKDAIGCSVLGMKSHEIPNCIKKLKNSIHHYNNMSKTFLLGDFIVAKNEIYSNMGIEKSNQLIFHQQQIGLISKNAKFVIYKICIKDLSNEFDPKDGCDIYRLKELVSIDEVLKHCCGGNEYSEGRNTRLFDILSRIKEFETKFTCGIGFPRKRFKGNLFRFNLKSNNVSQNFGKQLVFKDIDNMNDSDDEDILNNDEDEVVVLRQSNRGQLNGGLGQSNGVEQSNRGLGQSNGVEQSNRGLGQSNGVGQSNEGLVQQSNGALQLNRGLGQLDGGLRQSNVVSDIGNYSIRDWTVDQVYEHFKEMKMSNEMLRVIRDEEIDGSVLVTLKDHEILKEAGFSTFGSRLKILFVTNRKRDREYDQDFDEDDDKNEDDNYKNKKKRKFLQ